MFTGEKRLTKVIPPSGWIIKGAIRKVLRKIFQSKRNYCHRSEQQSAISPAATRIAKRFAFVPRCGCFPGVMKLVSINTQSH
jgi:hypothetical protein